MSQQTYGPRRIEPGFVKRWFTQAFKLIFRDPLLFVAAYVFFFVLDRIVQMVEGDARALAMIVFIAAAPIFTNGIMLLARWADTRTLGSHLRHHWVITAYQGMLQAFLSVLFVGAEYLGRHRIAFMSTDYPWVTATDAAFVCTMWYNASIMSSLIGTRFNLTFMETMVFIGRGFEINSNKTAIFILASAAVCMIVANETPISMFVDPALLIFFFTTVYVGYRDIYEHEEGNAELKKKTVLKSAIQGA